MSEFPKIFESRLLSDGLGDVLVALNGVSPTSIRLNPYKNARLDYDMRSVAWCGDGFYLPERPKFTLDPFLHGGAYYVQEASSMIVGEIARKYNPKVVLDLCAAPGGKSTHLASVVGLEGCVVANEVIRSRATILSENVQKWGSGNVVVTSSDAKNFGSLNGLFDIVVIDVPCSGEGMFRKDVASRSEWSVDNVALCAARGRRIVSDAWNALKEEGILIYSTCTFNRAENQDNVEWICRNLGATVEQVTMPPGVEVDEWGANFFPGRVDGEGFFVSVLRKTSSVEYDSTRSGKCLTKVSKCDLGELRRWIDSDLDFRLGGDLIYGYNEFTSGLIDQLMPLGVVYSGVAMGGMMRGELKPSHSLALFCKVRRDNVSVLESNEALMFLAKQNLSLGSYADGLSLVTFGGVGLGWAKGLGRRVNNLYPQNWRILNL